MSAEYNMPTLAEKFASRLVYLKEDDNHLVCSSNNISSTIVADLCSVLTKFNEDFIGILKKAQKVYADDVPRKSNELYQLALDKRYVFPSLKYFGLYEALINLLNKLLVVPCGQEKLATSLLKCLCFTLIFVEENTRIDLPAEVVGKLYQLRNAGSVLQECVMTILCRKIIPLCFGVVTEKSLKALEDVPNIIMLVLECVEDVSLHFQLIETLMMFKDNLWIDIMLAISCSDGIARVFATQLLFHYWPHLRSTSSSLHEISTDGLYKNAHCDNPNCLSLPSLNAATSMILDAAYPTKVAKIPPPLYLCNTCTQETVSREGSLEFIDVVLPTQQVTYFCENKHCLNENSVATVTLLGSKSNLNSDMKFFSQVQKHNRFWHYENKIVRYCNECYGNLKHVTGSLNLSAQLSPTSAWDQDSPSNTRIIVDAVVSLLTEEVDFGKDDIIGDESRGESFFKQVVYPCEGCSKNISFRNKVNSLDQFGAWLLISLCPPRRGIDQELVSQLITAVLLWHRNTAMLPGKCALAIYALSNVMLPELNRKKMGDNPVSSRNNVRQWLNEMYQIYFKNFVYCLLPNPPSEARVRGYWDTIQPLWYQYEMGLELLTSLAGCSILRSELWEYLMPCWLTAFCENLNYEDLKRLEKAINLLLSDHFSPLEFKSSGLYNFFDYNFESSSILQHEDALEWLQVLCELNVEMPKPKVFDLLSASVSKLQLAAYNQNDEARIVEDFAPADKYYHSSILTDKEYSNILSKSRCPGVDPMSNILDAINAPCSSYCDDIDCGKFPSVFVTSEQKKSIRRGSSSRASSRIKAAFLKPKRSLTRRSRRLSEDVVDIERLSQSSMISLSSPRVSLSKTEPSAERKIGSEWNTARVLSCYVDTLDILQKQLFLSNHSKHGGLRSECSMPIANILCKLLWHILENNEENLVPTDMKSPHVIAELNFLQEFFQLSCNLLAYILPETKVQTAAESKWNVFSKPINLAMDSDCVLGDQNFRDFSLSIQLFYLLVEMLEYYKANQTISIHLIECITLLCIKEDIFSFFPRPECPKSRNFEFYGILRSLWTRLDVRYSDSARGIVAVIFKLLYSIENAWACLMQLFNSSFRYNRHSAQDKSIEAWSKETETLDRIHAILMFACNHEVEYMTSRSPISHVVAYALSLLLAVLRRRSTAVYIKAKFVLDSLSKKNLEVANKCLQFEFDMSYLDRTFVISQYLLLHKLRPDSRPLSFARFSHMMEIMFKKDSKKDKKQTVVSTVAGVSNFTTFSEWLQKADLIDEIDCDFAVKKYRKNPTFLDDISRGPNFVTAELDTAPLPTSAPLTDDNSILDSLMKACCVYMIDCEAELTNQLQSKDCRSFLHYLKAWVGYNAKVCYISCPPHTLRGIVGVSTFLQNLSKILDTNLVFGNVILSLTLCLLEVVVKMVDETSNYSKDCSEFDLGVLDTVDQIAWLKVVQVIMYKYTVKEVVQLDQLSRIIVISMNLLSGEYHTCKKEAQDTSADDKTKKNDKSLGSNLLKRRFLDKNKVIESDLFSKHKTSSFLVSSEQCHKEEYLPLLDDPIKPSTSSRQDLTIHPVGQERKNPFFKAASFSSSDNTVRVLAARLKRSADNLNQLGVDYSKFAFQILGVKPVYT